MPKQSQVETAAQDQAEEAVESQAENTTEVVEQIGQLLGNEQPTEAVEAEEPTEEQPQAEEPETKEPERPLTIDEDMVKQYPRLKMYLGKNLKEDLPKAYDNVVQAYLKDHQELIKIKQEQAKKLPELSDIPDPVEKPEDHKKWLADYTEQVRQAALLEAKNQPQPIDIVSEVGKVLPQGTDVKSVIDQFTMYNASRFYNELGELRPEVASFYDKHPEVLLNEIQSFHNLYSNASKNKNVIAKESKDTAYKTIKTSLKKAQENREDVQGLQFNAVPRTDASTAEEEILAKIYKIAEGG